MARRSTVSDETIRDLHADGLTDSEIASVVGLGYDRIKVRRSGLGLRPNPRPRSVDHDLVVQLLKEGRTSRSIAAEVKCSPSYVSRIGRREGIKDTYHLTEEDKDRIRTCVEDGWPYEEIQRTYGYAPKTIRRLMGPSSFGRREAGKISYLNQKYSDVV